MKNWKVFFAVLAIGCGNLEAEDHQLLAIAGLSYIPVLTPYPSELQSIIDSIIKYETFHISFGYNGLLGLNVFEQNVDNGIYIGLGIDGVVNTIVFSSGNLTIVDNIFDINICTRNANIISTNGIGLATRKGSVSNSALTISTSIDYGIGAVSRTNIRFSKLDGISIGLEGQMHIAYIQTAWFFAWGIALSASLI